MISPPNAFPFGEGGTATAVTDEVYTNNFPDLIAMSTRASAISRSASNRASEHSPSLSSD
jgi:hypothetical protein